MKVLLIEDDRETADFIAQGLGSVTSELIYCDNGADGLSAGLAQIFDVMIIDRMLPNLDGVTIVKSLRAKGNQTPILFLTAMSAVADRVDGLEAGSDDYLTKPFSMAELKARIRALARRHTSTDKSNIITIGDLKIDRMKREVSRAETVISLQAREYQLLDYFLTHQDEIVTRSMMLEDLWGFSFDPGTNIVESHISRLRAKITKPDGPQIIKTIRGAGYVLVAS